LIASLQTDNQTQSAEILLRLLITDQRYNDTAAIDGKVSIGSANQTLSYCGNITGATSNLCTLVDTDTYSSTYNASNITNAPWLTSYTDTNDTVVVDTLLLSNASQQLLIANLQTDNQTQSAEILLRLLITDQRYNETGRVDSLNLTKLDAIDQRYNESSRVDSLNTTKVNIGSANQTLSYCGNITGATSNLCTLVDTDTFADKSGVQPWLSNTSTAISLNVSRLSLEFLNLTDQRYNETTLVGLVNASSKAYTDSMLITTIYNATSIVAITGTTQGAISNITKYDSVSYNVSESSSDIDFRVNFTGITDFNQIIVRYKSDSAESHTMDIALWDNASNSWESYRTVGASPDYNIMTMNVYDIADHIVGGVVQIRFYSVNVGSSTHKHQFDWVAISDGPATPSSSETDPYSIHKDGNVPLTGNWDAGAFNITASNIIALINASRVLLPPWLTISDNTTLTAGIAAGVTDNQTQSAEILLRLLITDQRYNDTVAISGKVSIGAANQTISSCLNITGATSNLCTLVDTDTFADKSGVQPWLSNTSTTISLNVSRLALEFLNLTDQRYNETVLFNQLVDSNISIWSRLNGLTNDSNTFGTGTLNYLAKFKDATNITNSSIVDDGSTISIGDGASFFELSTDGVSVLFNTSYTANFTKDVCYGADCLSAKLNIIDQRYNETAKILSVNGTVTGLLNDNSSNVKINSANQTLSYCGNITGATSNLCTLVDTDTFADKSGVQPWLSNTSTAISLNVSRLSLEFLNLTDQRYNETTLVGLVNASSKAYTDSMLITTIYNATSIVAITGTTQGAISNITKYDSVSYNVSESSSDIDFRVNFTGITDFNQIIVRYKSDSAESHTMDIALWDNASNSWESYRTVGASPDYNIMTMNVYDIADHIVGGVVQIRFYSVNVGSSTHKHQFDWVAISDGPATPSSSETDPYSIHKDGNVPLTGNWDAGAFNITASNIIALINASRVLLPPWLTISDNTTLTAGIAAGVTDNQTQSAEILLRLLITDQRYNDTVAISGKVSIGAANQTISSCLNITGATSNLCTLVDTDTFADKSGVQPWLSNTSTTISLNVSRLALEFLNLTDQRYNETVLFNQLVDSNISIWSRLNGLTNDSNTFGTGTLNYLAKFKDATNITNSSIVDDGSTISIGDGASFFELSTDGVSVLFNTSYTANFTKDVCYGADCLSAKLNIIDQRYNETAKILSVNGTVTGLLNDNSSNVKINSANQTLSYCGNITGATSNLCTLVDTDTYSSTYNASNITNAPWLLTAPYSSTYNASNITNAPWITSYTDTNDTVVVATLLLSNASQQLLIASLQTDNQTQAAEILLRLLITDQRYNESSRVDSLNTTKVNIGSANLTLVACQNVTGAASDLCTLVAGAGTVTQIDFTGPQITGGSVTATGTVSLNVTWLSLEFLNLTDQIYNETALFDKLVVSNSSMNDRMVLAEASIISIGLSNITLTGGIAGLVNSNTSIWARLNGLTNDNTTIWGKVNGLINDNTSIRLDITGLKADNVTHRTDNTTQSGLINARALPGACAVNTFGVATTTSGLTCIQPNYLNITGTVPYQSSAAGFVNTTILITAAVNINMTQKNITTVKCILFTNGAKIGECD
jgi:hypothetical protein